MSTFVYMTRCDGCGHCVDICPSDIMHIDENIRRAKNIEPNFCWECYSCVKICPQGAIMVRGYDDFVPMGGQVHPMRSSDSIMWSVKFRNKKIFVWRHSFNFKKVVSIWVEKVRWDFAIVFYLFFSQNRVTRCHFTYQRNTFVFIRKPDTP